jgi:hypothetical protein
MGCSPSCIGICSSHDWWIEELADNIHRGGSTFRHSYDFGMLVHV